MLWFELYNDFCKKGLLCTVENRVMKCNAQLSIYSQRKKDINPYNTRPMESTPLLQPKSGI